eukprot:m.341636 g.341636  ORF g.341636 m.341636 type:complete len:344 (+) comp20286_c0_seq1:245-1276(+)
MMKNTNVMVWNVLAHIHTHHQAKSHGGEEKSLETVAQRYARHLLIGKVLNRQAPDLVLLQEVDETLIPNNQVRIQLPWKDDSMNYARYSYHTAMSRGRHAETPLEGVAILLKEGVWERDPSCRAMRVEKTAARGWKSALVLPVRQCDNHSERLTLISVHLKYDNDNAKMKLLQDAMSAVAEGADVILGGDFNTKLEHIAPLDALLQAYGLYRIPSAPHVPTSLGSAMRYSPESVIDYIYVGCKLRSVLSTCVVGPLPPDIKGPWEGLELDPKLAIAHTTDGPRSEESNSTAVQGQRSGDRDPETPQSATFPVRNGGFSNKNPNCRLNDGSDHAWLLATITRRF